MMHRLTICLALFLLAGVTAIAAPPSGRPPQEPLERFGPEIFSVKMSVAMYGTMQHTARESYKHSFALKNTPIYVPVVFQSTWSRINPDSLDATLTIDSRDDPGVNDRSRLEEGFPFSTHLAVIVIDGPVNAQSVRWSFGYEIQVWNSRINDEQAMAAIAWPREWPEEVRDGLKPQLFIQSDAPIFAETVARISEGKLRQVPLWYAAKDIIRYCVQNIRNDGLGSSFGDHGELVAMELYGALQAAEDGSGSPHDIVCVCVAMLRAAGIPARPVVGIQKPADSEQIRFDSWLEFYMPDAGWVPVDPVRMRDHGVRHREVQESWPYFGNIEDLHKRIPLAFHFHPPTRQRLMNTHDYRNRSRRLEFQPAVWGWRPGRGDVRSSAHSMTFDVQYEGPGHDVTIETPGDDER